MPLMTWNPKMSVGIASIDEQHKKLVGMLNDLYDGIAANHAKEKLAVVLDGLIAYTANHFKYEERFFAQTGYPDTAAHVKEHQDLTNQVLDVQRRFKAGEAGTLSMEVLNFLKQWLVNHIQGSDKRYAPHLNAKGVH